MFTWLIPAADLVAIALLALALFFPRHRRGDLVVAYLALNVGVLAVAEALIAAGGPTGLGLGIFGVLSIIRLRSMELDQHEIAYYFSALALGMIGGLGAPMGWLALALMAVIVLVIGIADAPGLLGRVASQTVVLDHLVPDAEALRPELEAILGAPVTNYQVKRQDLVSGHATVQVRYRAGGSARKPNSQGRPAGLGRRDGAGGGGLGAGLGAQPATSAVPTFGLAAAVAASKAPETVGAMPQYLLSSPEGGAR